MHAAQFKGLLVTDKRALRRQAPTRNMLDLVGIHIIGETLNHHTSAPISHTPSDKSAPTLKPCLIG